MSVSCVLGAIDSFARGLKNAAKLIEDGQGEFKRIFTRMEQFQRV